MKVRALPPLQPLCERHNHVVLLWDERIEGRALLGVGAQRSILVDTPRSGDWALWEAFIQESESKSAWSFGWLGYDLHDSLDLAAESECPSPVPPHPSAWPLLHWWEPEVVLEWAPGQEMAVVVAGADTPLASEITSLLDAAHEPTRRDAKSSSTSWHPLTPSWSREEYETKFNAVRTALQRGDIYEMNLCMPWSGAAPANESWTMFERLAANTKAPHSAYVQAGPWRTLCASPERFLAKRGNTLHSQPI